MVLSLEVLLEADRPWKSGVEVVWEGFGGDSSTCVGELGSWDREWVVLWRLGGGGLNP